MKNENGRGIGRGSWVSRGRALGERGRGMKERGKWGREV